MAEQPLELAVGELLSPYGDRSLFRHRAALFGRVDIGYRDTGGAPMNWNITTRSKTVATRFGKIAVRVNGGPDMAPLLLCQRFRGTMEDWDPSSSPGSQLVAKLSGSTARGSVSLKVKPRTP
jgi:hypothetical protein